MINGFEHITSELNEYELKTLLPTVVAGLSRRRGKVNAITNKSICKAMKDRGFHLSDARLRKLVNYVRVNGIIKGLVATSSGYFVSDSLEELESYAESLRQRKNEIGRVEQSILRDLEYYKQLKHG